MLKIRPIELLLYQLNLLSAAVETEFIPWLMESVDEQLQKSTCSRQILDALIREVVQSRNEQFAQLEAEEAQVAEAGDTSVETSTAAVVIPSSADDGPRKEVCSCDICFFSILHSL